jgi:hypothetical protein
VLINPVEQVSLSLQQYRKQVMCGEKKDCWKSHFQPLNFKMKDRRAGKHLNEV